MRQHTNCYLSSVGLGGCYLVKNILQLVLRQSTALDVFHRAQLLSHPLTILPPYRRHLLFGQFLSDTGVISQIDLGTNNEARNTRAVVVDFGKPLLADVFERGGRSDAETHEEDIGLGIREGSKSVVIFLTSGIKQA